MSGVSGRYLAAAHNLGLLQELVRKDPESYKEEFLEQFRHYETTLRLLELQPHQHRMDLDPLLEVVNFLSTVAPSYPEHAKTFATNLIDILRTQGQGLDPEVRLAFCKALVALRNRNAAPAFEVLELFFELVKCEDKILRKFLFGSIVAQIKRLHTQKKDQRLITTLQSFTFAKLKDSRSIVARTAQLVLIETYRKGFWRDAKTANAIAECCFHKIARVQVAALKFFLGSSKDEEGLEDGDGDSEHEGKQEDAKTLKEVMTAFRAGKKTRKKIKNLEKAKKAIDKQHKAKKGDALLLF
uniref:Protein SDA1 n=1 Tax=Plectus sambesii TaxID=2011161 RepID=A0A914WUG2_9BILA